MLASLFARKKGKEIFKTSQMKHFSRTIPLFHDSSTTPIEMTKLNHMDEISGRVPTFVRRLIV